jgi:hypothetical protein
MSLQELVDDTYTDKNTTHSYLPLYQKLLEGKKETALNVLEIGIGDFGWKNGGSMKLWNEFFTNANIYGLDVRPLDSFLDGLTTNNKIFIYTSTDAYNTEFVTETFVNKNIKFDFMLDDGPHNLESMLIFIQLYSQLMTDDGILMIEDVQSWDWIETLTNAVPEHLKPFVKSYDLRENKGRYDDIIFTIDKSEKSLV